MKIIILADWPIGEPYGGVQVHTVNLCNYLANFDDLQLYVLSIGEKSLIINNEKIKIKIIKRTSLQRIFPILSAIRIFFEITKIDPDIIHIQGSWISPFLIYSILLAPRRYKRVMTIHGLVGIEAHLSTRSNMITKLYDIALEKLAIKCTPNLIVCSQAMEILLGKYQMTNARVSVIPNGIEFEKIQAIRTANLNHPNVVFVGRLVKAKGVETLIKAIEIVRKSIPNINLYIIGSGPIEGQLQSLVRQLDLEKNVAFLGRVSDVDKFSYLKAADICVFPSVYEPFGIVLLEAMACGTPVIASNVGGIPYVLNNGGAGILCTPGDPQDFARSIINLISNDDLRRELSIAGKNRAREFSWENIASMTRSFYYSLLNL